MDVRTLDHVNILTGNVARTHALDASQGDAAKRGTKGIVDHVAFRCSGYREAIERLRSLGVPIHEATIPGVGDRQVFVDGPDDVSFELIFSAADVAGATK